MTHNQTTSAQQFDLTHELLVQLLGVNYDDQPYEEHLPYITQCLFGNNMKNGDLAMWKGGQLIFVRQGDKLVTTRQATFKVPEEFKPTYWNTRDNSIPMKPLHFNGSLTTDHVLVSENYLVVPFQVNGSIYYILGETNADRRLQDAQHMLQLLNTGEGYYQWMETSPLAGVDTDHLMQLVTPWVGVHDFDEDEIHPENENPPVVTVNVTADRNVTELRDATLEQPVMADTANVDEEALIAAE